MNLFYVFITSASFYMLVGLMSGLIIANLKISKILYGDFRFWKHKNMLFEFKDKFDLILKEVLELKDK